MLNEQPINIQGFEIPSRDPAFLAILAIHVVAGLTCVVAGLIAILSRKQKGRHSLAGLVYYWILWVVFITATTVAFLRWKEDDYLFFLGLASFVTAVIGRRAARKKWKKWTVSHTILMSCSYIFLLIAFYMDNGRFLPLWKDLDPIFYWLLPVIIGIPLVVRTLFKHPLTKQYMLKRKKSP